MRGKSWQEWADSRSVQSTGCGAAVAAAAHVAAAANYASAHAPHLHAHYVPRVVRVCARVQQLQHPNLNACLAGGKSAMGERGCPAASAGRRQRACPGHGGERRRRAQQRQLAAGSAARPIVLLPP